MNVIVEKYEEQQVRLPASGKHIIGQFDDEYLVVYQAYNHSIADFAVKNQHLGGNGYSYSRMTWIKPNFLWMMFRAGWATKENQERILAIMLSRKTFESILAEAVHTSFKSSVYSTEADWKLALNASDVRIQWDPDHSPSGHPMERRAIQIGMKGKTAEQYAKEWIVGIEDITEFVHQQKQILTNRLIQELLVPKEAVYQLTNSTITDYIYS